jgi:hypothetical protein
MNLQTSRGAELLKTLVTLFVSLAMCISAHAESAVISKEFLGNWCHISVEGAWPQTFHQKRNNTECAYGWKISATTIWLWDGSDKCRISHVEVVDEKPHTLLVLGKGKRPCFSAEVWREKETLFMQKVQP